MALTKPIEQPSTITTYYHRIRQIISLAFTGGAARCELWGETYASAEARAAGAAPVDGQQRFDVELTATEAALVLRILYGAVRREHMPDAEDHIGADDPDLTAWIATLRDDELTALAAAVDNEQAIRSITP